MVVILVIQNTHQKQQLKLFPKQVFPFLFSRFSFLLNSFENPGKDTRDEFVLNFKQKSEKTMFLNQFSPLVKDNRLCFGRPIQDVAEVFFSLLFLLLLLFIFSLNLTKIKPKTKITKQIGKWIQNSQYCHNCSRYAPKKRRTTIGGYFPYCWRGQIFNEVSSPLYCSLSPWIFSFFHPLSFPPPLYKE